MYIGFPQLIYIFLSILGLALSIANHGKPRSDENALISILGSMIVYALLFWGGFFSK